MLLEGPGGRPRVRDNHDKRIFVCLFGCIPSKLETRGTPKGSEHSLPEMEVVRGKMVTLLENVNTCPQNVNTRPQNVNTRVMNFS